jgi:hypothetical protein
LPCAVHGHEAEVEVAVHVQTRVRGPHPGIRLANCLYSVLHRASPKRSATGRESVTSLAVSVQLEKRGGIADGGQLCGIDAGAGTEGLSEAASR